VFRFKQKVVAVMIITVGYEVQNRKMKEFL